MIKFPDSFVIPYEHVPGYFWNVENQKLYSIKSGELREMKLYQPSRFSTMPGPYYRISVKGRHRSWSWERLDSKCKKKFAEGKTITLPFVNRPN